MTNMLLAESVKVNAGETFLICLIGFLLIMVVLALLIGVTCAMKWFLKKILKQSKNNDTAATATTTPVAEKELAKGSCGDFCLNNVSEREAAMVMAIVADQLQTPLNQLRFKSIGCVGEDN